MRIKKYTLIPVSNSSTPPCLPAGRFRGEARIQLPLKGSGKFKKVVSLALFLFLPLTAQSAEFDSFAIQQLGKLLANPPLFIYEFQRNMESTTPLPPGKGFGLNYHFLGGIIVVPLPDITSAGNISAKLRLHPEGRLAPGLPQFDLVYGFWDCLPASMLEDENATAQDSQTKLKKADLGGDYTAFVITSSLEPRVRLFWSYKISKLDIDITLSKPEEILGNQVTGFNGKFRENTLAAGFEHTYGLNKRWIIEGGYGLKNNVLSTRVMWSGRFLDLGVNIYPESVFVMQPQLNFHFNF